MRYSGMRRRGLPRRRRGGADCPLRTARFTGPRRRLGDGPRFRLRELNVDGSRVYYDSTSRPHHHVYNMDTGELTDLPRGSVAIAKMPELPEGTEAVGMELVIKVRNTR